MSDPTTKAELVDVESGDIAAAFNDENRTTTKQTTETPKVTKDAPTETTDDAGTTLLTASDGDTVELGPLTETGKTDTANFQVLTRDVSFATKVKLLLWKNMKIQFLRRPKSCCCKCCIPVLIMLIMVAMTAIEDIRRDVSLEYGAEFEYVLSNTGDAAQYANSPFSTAYLANTDRGNNLPWTDTSIANEWIRYIVCPDTQFQGGMNDADPPSYLAIVAPDYATNDNVQQLLSILANKYGDSDTYPHAWLTDKYLNPDSTWTFPFVAPDPTVNTTAAPSNVSTPSPTAATAAPTVFFTTARRRARNLLQTEPNPYCDMDVMADDTSVYNKTFLSYFPQKCGPFSCGVWSRDTHYLNFTEGSLLKFFNHESELEDYVKDEAYGNSGFNFENDNVAASRPIGAAIVFKETGGENGLVWDYKLRFNATNVPPTEGGAGKVDIFSKSNSNLFEYGLSYYLQSSGLPWLQTWLDEGIMEFGINQQYNPDGDDNAQFMAKMDEFQAKTAGYSKGVFQFPSYPYKQDDYWFYVGGTFPFFLFIMFCYPIITVLSILVEEKSAKIKEGMKMMGATTAAYWTSWTIWFFIEFTGMALLVSILGCGFGVFRYTSFAIIFLWFWLFCLSSAAFAMMFSTIFDNPKTASLVGLIIFFAVLIGAQSHRSLDSAGKTGLCVLSPACFVVSVDTIIQYETGTIGVNFDNIHDEYAEFKFVTVYIMMFVDIFIYMILTIYLDQVWPSAFGQKQPFYFFLLPSYWSKKCCKPSDERQLTLQRTMSKNVVTTAYEPVPDDKDEALIAIRNLSKTFKSFGLTENSRKEVRAVQKISLDMYRGEVFCLLGHNGAGKTTTISMMTGLLEITSGNAWIMNNNISDSQSMNEIRKHLGVCPQHNVLWDKLTVREHLWLFARLKGVPTNVVQAEVDKITADTGLSVDGNDRMFPKQMSGGQKRKLSLGIALVGGSQIVFLDEPTSGMDPQSRRVTWDLISREKKNRCMVLTTHFMDEADILGDRIAIMGNGKVKCCGSALFLKQQYGVGYTFTVSLEASDDTAKDIERIKKEVDAFVFDTIKGAEDVALAGSELTYRLPFEQAVCFSALFDILDDNKARLSIKSYGISVTTLEEVFLKIGHDEIDHAAEFSPDDELKSKVGMDETAKRAAQDQFKQPSMVSNFALQDQNVCQIFFIHVYAVLYKRFWWSLRDFKALICSLICPVMLSGMALGLMTITIASNQPEIQLSTTPGFYDHVHDVLIHSTNDTSGTPQRNGSDVPFYTIADNFYTVNNTLYDTYAASLEDGNGDMILTPIDVDAAEYINVSLRNVNQCIKYEARMGWYACTETTEYPAPPFPFYEGISEQFQDYLLELESEEYNAFLFFPYSMTRNKQKRVWFGVNGSAYHALPITVNLWNNWIFNDIMGDVDTLSITASMHPLPVTTRQDLISGQLSGFFAALYLVIAFSFIPAGAIYFMVNEKTNLTKHQQLVSGISFVAYWVSNYIADICIGLPASVLVFASVYMFDAEAFQEEAAGPFFLTLVMFLFSALPFTYLLSFVFTSPAKAQLGTILLYIIFGMILGLVSFILDMIPSTHDTNGDLKGLYRIFPVFLMCESLMNISTKPLLFPFNDYNDWEVCGRNYLLMFIEGVGYFALVLFLEYLSTFPVLLSKLGFVTDRPLTETDDDLDVDVLEEKKRILDAIITDEHGNVSIDREKCEDSVVMAGLRKVYDPAGSSRIIPCLGKRVADADKIEAVTNLYFGVKQSEVFGYLGVNGAGKTTTLATLTGERYPSAGNAFIANFPISNQLQCRRYVGYCPQFDAIFDLLTGAEHLKFYAMIKGLSGNEADAQVKVLLSALTLNKYKSRTAGTYSGGNKRKLSVAVSMIGNPPIILLDEPSTGMDPVSRRHMWEFISTTMAGRCVILTTHSMEEVEALCNRVGIMVNGQLKCIGTAQHLKSRYGKGYQLDITLTQRVTNNDDEKEKSEQLNRLQNELEKHFGETTLIEFNGSRISYELAKDENELKLGAMFNILEDIKGNEFKGIIQAYALSQTTLEQIFIRMAKQGEEEKNNFSLL